MMVCNEQQPTRGSAVGIVAVNPPEKARSWNIPCGAWVGLLLSRIAQEDFHAAVLGLAFGRGVAGNGLS